MAPDLFLRALTAAGTAGVLVLAVNAVGTIGPGSSGSAPGGIVPALVDPGPVPGEPLVGDDPVTIAFAGDIHFEKQLAPVAADPQGLASLSIPASGIPAADTETAVVCSGLDAAPRSAPLVATAPGR